MKDIPGYITTKDGYILPYPIDTQIPKETNPTTTPLPQIKK